MKLDFTLEPKITKSYLLSQHSEETYLEFYLGLPVKKGLFTSPLRKDNTPTCSFYRNKSGELIFHDFSGAFYGNFISVVMYKYGCSYGKALKIIAEDFGLTKSHTNKETIKIPESSTKFQSSGSADIKVEIKDFTEKELKWWKEYGITKEILKRFHVYSCKSVFLNGELVNISNNNNLMFGYYGGTMKENSKKLELWKIYFPNRKSYRFLGNYPAKKLQGYNQLPKTGKMCVITKSMKDCMALYAYGIPACAPNSETVIPSEVIVDDLLSRFEYVFCLWDNDETGVTFLNKIKRRYPKLHCLIIPRRYNAKDFSDLRKLYGYKKTKELIIDYLKYFKAKDESNT